MQLGLLGFLRGLRRRAPNVLARVAGGLARLVGVRLVGVVLALARVAGGSARLVGVRLVGAVLALAREGGGAVRLVAAGLAFAWAVAGAARLLWAFFIVRMTFR